MRKKRDTETDEQRIKRREEEAQRGREDAAAEDDAMHALIKRSIETHGP
jgi:hypothetical protein